MGAIRYMNVRHHGRSARAPFPGLRASRGLVDDSANEGAEETRAGEGELRSFLGFQEAAASQAGAEVSGAAAGGKQGRPRRQRASRPSAAEH